MAVRVLLYVRSLFGVAAAGPNRSLTNRCSASVRGNLHVRVLLGVDLGIPQPILPQIPKAPPLRAGDETGSMTTE